jgi:hypothetical protein
MKQFYGVLTGMLLLLCFSGCESALKVTSDYDKSVDFQQYKTFTIHQISDESKKSVSSLNEERIYNAIRREMTKRNFQESPNGELLVHTAAIFKDKQSVTANTNYYGYGGYYRPYGWGGGMGASGYTTYNVQDYKDGSLIIDIVDAKSQKLVWEGVGNKEIDKPAKDVEKALNEAIASILADFPPGAKKKK